MFAPPRPPLDVQVPLWAWRRLGLLLLLIFALPAFAADSVVPASTMPWWFWPLALFATCFLIGIVAVPAGIGGGTLFAGLPAAAIATAHAVYGLVLGWRIGRAE